MSKHEAKTEALHKKLGNVICTKCGEAHKKSEHEEKHSHKSHHKDGSKMEGHTHESHHKDDYEDDDDNEEEVEEKDNKKEINGDQE